MLAPPYFRWPLFLAVVFAGRLQPTAVHAIAVGELDAFAVDLEGWSQGASGTPTAGVTRATSGGPAGTGDAYMRIVADGASTQGKVVVNNRSSAWTGDYLTAGVSAISMSVNNLGASALKLRVALGTEFAPENGGTWLASTSSLNLAAGSGWNSIQFPLGAANLTRVQGTADYSTVMGGVVALRLLHSNSPDNRGTNIVATLGADNILAVGAPIPGDFDNNNAVNGADLLQWRDDYGLNDDSDADVDGDSDGADFLAWQKRLGQGPPGAASGVPVPEPAGLALAALAMGGHLWRRRAG